MKYTRVVIAWVVIVLAILGGEGGVSLAGDRLHQFTLDNGLRVVLEENRSAPVVALQVWVEVGSGDEDDKEAGMCHFIEHMLFKGTPKRKVREMAREIESLGGSINAYTSYDQTVYHITIASRYADVGLDILSDAIQHSTFDPVELEREREVVLEEIRMGEDDPGRKLFRQTMAAVFQRHPYRRPIIGYEETIRSIQRDRMVAFYRRWYVPNRMVLIAVGDFDPREMEPKVREAFKEFNPSPGRFPSRAEEPGEKEFRSVITAGNYKETYLQIAVPIPSLKGEDTPVLDALALVLGGGETSRLVQKVKLEKGLVNSISASSFTPKDPGLFIIGATLAAENLEKALGAIFEELSRLGQEGVTQEELYRVKLNVESDLIYDRQTVQGQARKLGYYKTIAGDLQFEREYLTKISLLQSEEIQKAVKKYFARPSWSVSILTPEEKVNLIKGVPLQETLRRMASHKDTVGEKKSGAVRKLTLDNGLRLIVKENRTLPVVTLQASFLGGVRFEEEAKNGINQFMAVMVTKGTENRTSLEIAKKVERMAGALSGFSGFNSFGITFTFLSQHVDEAFSLFEEVIKQPSFDPEEMEKRRRLILAGIRQQEDDLDRIVFKLFRKTLYQKHPYRMDTLGTLESVQKLTREDLKENFRRIAVPENMVLTIVGDVDADQMVLSVKKRFGDLRRGKTSFPSLPQEIPLQEVRRSVITKSKEQAHFVLGFLGATLRDEDHLPLEVLDAALSGQGGRLFYELRDKESLAYALAFFSSSNIDRGYIGVYMGTHPDKLDRAIEGVLRELKKVREEGLTEDEVERAKKYLIGNFEIGLQTNKAQANLMSLDELYGLGFDHYLNYAQGVQKVTREEVHRVAQKYFNLEAYAIAIVQPPAGKKE